MNVTTDYRLNITVFKILVFLWIIIAAAAMPAVSRAETAETSVDTLPPADTITSVQIIAGEDMTRLPIRPVEEALFMLPGTAELPDIGQNQQRPADIGRSRPKLHVRGGRQYQTDFVFNGISFKNQIEGFSTATVSPHAVREMRYYPGGFTALYGRSGSGFFDLLSSPQASKYSVMVEGLTDNLSGSGGFDQNYYTARIDGPIPGLEEGSFFGLIERRWLADRNPSAITDEVLPGGPDRLPHNWQSGWSYHGGIDYRPMSSLSMTLRADGSKDVWKEYWHEFLFEPNHTPKYEDKNFGASGRLDYIPDDMTAMSLAVSYFESKRIHGDGVVFDDLEAYQREAANPEFDFYNLFREGDSLFASEFDLIHDTLANTEYDTFVTFYDAYYPRFVHHQSSYIGLSGDISRKLHDYITVKVGGDYRRHTVRYFEHMYAPYPGFNYNLVNRYGFDSLGNVSDNEDFDNETKHPIELGLYGEGRAAVNGFSGAVGFRLDRFDYNTLASKAFTRISPRLTLCYQAFETIRVFFNHGTYYERVPFRYSFVGWDFFMYRLDSGSYYPFGNPGVEPEKTIQQELGLAINHEDIAGFEISAFHKDVDGQIQIITVSPALPTEYMTYANIDNSTIRGLEISGFVSPTRNLTFSADLVWSKAKGTGAYVSSNFNIAWKNPQGVPAQQTALDFDQRLDFIGRVDLHTMENEGPVIGGLTPFENLSLSAVVQAHSGYHYTPTLVYDAVSPNVSVTREPTGPVNSDNQPSQFSIDLKLEKTLAVGSFKLTPFIMIKNLLNRENILYVYTATGQPDSCGYLESPEGQTRASDDRISNTGLTRGEEFVSRYTLAENNPLHYGPPRQIFLGLRALF